MKMQFLRTSGTALLLATASLAVAMPPASAKSGDVVRQGSCSGHSHWKLQAGARDRGIETEFQVDSNRAGQRWNVRLADNGVQVFAGTATTTPRSGSFTVERRIANRQGVDHIVATARNTATGETCHGSVNV